MFVVVVGSRDWSGQQAEQKVRSVLDGLREKYSGLVIVTSSSDRGIGDMVKRYCLKDHKTFQLIDMHVRVFASLPRPKMNQLFRARDKMLTEVGEEFHIFIDPDRHGAFEDLAEMVKSTEASRPLFLHAEKEEVL